ncbi:MAG: sigma-70 family RNA polymerase sigma factor [Verrucomicrobiota bacterium]
MPDPFQTTTTDEPAFVSDLTAHQGVLHAFLVSLLPGSQDVDDVLQRTNLVLWEKRGKFQTGSNFKAWALAVAYWEVRAWMTERRRGEWLVIDDELAQAILQRFSEAPPRAPGAAVSAVRSCLGKLADQDRLLVLAHHQHEKSLHECSRIFNRSANSLSVSLVRIRAALRICVKAKLAVEEARS